MNKIEKLELKHLKNYLGTGLKCQYTGIINGKELSAEHKRLNSLDVFDPEYKCEVMPEYGLKIGELKEIKVYKNYWTAHVGIQRRGLKTFGSGSDFKLCLLPLSAVTEPLEDGTVPAIIVAKIIANIHNDDMDDKWTIKDDGRILIKTPWDLRIEIFYKTDTICFAVYDTWNHCEKRTIDQHKALEYLYSKHFDIFDLIGSNLAIDKRIIKL